MLLGVASPAMAADSLTPNSDWSAYFIFPGTCDNYSSSYPHSYLAFAIYSSPGSSFSVDVDANGNVVNLYAHMPERKAVYLCGYVQQSDGSYKWTQFKNHSFSRPFVEGSDIYQISSTSTPIISQIHDVIAWSSPIKIYGTDEVFPPAPPLVNLTEELIQMTPGALDLDGKMKILVPFGISCLALLISLPLLLKVSRRFLG